MAAVTVRWFEAPHGECRVTVNYQAYKHGKSRHYDRVSIPILTGFFKLILFIVMVWVTCNNTIISA